MSSPQHQYVCPNCRAGRLVTDEDLRWAVTCFACGGVMAPAAGGDSATVDPASTVPMAQPIQPNHGQATPASPAVGLPVAKPLDAAPANADGAGGYSMAAEEPEENSWIADNLGMVLGMILLVTVATAIVILALSGIQFTPSQEDPGEIVIGPDGVRHVKEPTYHDASTKSIRRQGVKLSISRVEFDRLWARDETNAVVRSNASKWIVHVRVNNQVDLDRAYTRWGVGSGAELLDSNGNSFPLTSLEPYKEVMGRSRDGALPPGEVIRDIVVFEATGVALEEVEWLRIKLPAEVFGGDGAFYFQMPSSMIEEPAPDAPPPYWAEEPADEPTEP